MTREEAINHLKTVAKTAIDSGYDSAIVDAVDMAREALEQEPCGKDINVPATDAISRQAVLDGLASIAKAKARSDAQKSLMGRVIFFTEHLPSVTPQPKTGHWIPVSERLPEYVLGETSDDILICVTDSLGESQTISTGFRGYYPNSKPEQGWWSMWAYGCSKISDNCKVLAWMQLPELYKAEKEKE